MYRCQTLYPRFPSSQPHISRLHISRYPHKPASLWYSRVIPTPWSSIIQEQSLTPCLFPHPSIPPDALELYQVSYVLPESLLPSFQTLCYLNTLSGISVAFRHTSVREALSGALCTRFVIMKIFRNIKLSLYTINYLLKRSGRAMPVTLPSSEKIQNICQITNLLYHIF